MNEQLSLEEAIKLYCDKYSYQVGDIKCYKKDNEVFIYFRHSLDKKLELIYSFAL